MQSSARSSPLGFRPGKCRSVALIISGCAAFLLTACATPHNTSANPVAVPAADKPISPVRPPDSAAAYHFMLGYQAELSQDTETAMKEYHAALKTDPSSHSVKARLAGLYFSLGDTHNALRYAEEAAEGSDQNAHVLTQMAGIFASAGQGERAVALLDKAIAQEPDVGDPYFAKGLLLLNLKRTGEAEQSMRAGLVRSPDSAVGQYHLGRVLLESGKAEEAATSFERAMAVNPSFEPAYMALTSIYESRQEKERAIAVLKKYLNGVNPQNRDIRHHLIRLYVESKDYKGAMAELDALLEEDPSDLDAQLRMALLYGEQKEYAKAIERLTLILKSRPAELKVRDYLGYMYEESKETKKAIETYLFNIQLEPTFYEGHLHVGVLYYRLKQFPEAIEHLGRAVSLNPKQPEAYIVLGLAYLQEEQFANSVEVFEDGIRHNPKSADLHFNLGTAYDKLNRFDEVVRVMEAAIKLDPHHADALNYLGYSYAERGVKVDQALSLTKQAVALKPENGYYVDSLGWAFFKSGLLSEALREIKRAVSLVGDDPVIYEHLGDIYAKQQRLSDAREAWLHALELEPSNIKLMERFRELGMGDPAEEERVVRAKQRIADRKGSPTVTP
jgi:tetratricopeptide (TPR) repeat protein